MSCSDTPDEPFYGVWIPRTIWLTGGLSVLEKLLLSVVHESERDYGCRWSNQHFADFFDLTPVRMSQVVNQLVKKGFLTSRRSERGAYNGGCIRTLHIVSEKLAK